MSPARLLRFAQPTGDRNRSLRTYVWNAQLCEAFYLPLQFSEVTVRNAIHKTLTRRFGAEWPTDPACVEQLPRRYQDEVHKAVHDERNARGAAFTVDHVVANMTFGFWVHLLTSRYENILWNGGVSRSFPNVPRRMTREQMYRKVSQLRAFRNRVMHHYAIFDRRPMAEYQNLLEVVGFICTDSEWLIRQIANPARVLGQRPRA